MFSSSSKHTDHDAVSPFKNEGNLPALPSTHGATVIAQGVKLEGDFTSQGDVVIEGEVHGKVTASGKLTVGSDAVIHADVSADDAVISGLIEGNVTVKTQIVLHATARVTGDISAERAVVESGAALDGRVQIGAKGTSNPKAAPPQPPVPEAKEEKKEGEV